MMAKINRVKKSLSFWNPDILFHEALTNKLGHAHMHKSAIQQGSAFCFAFGDVYLITP